MEEYNDSYIENNKFQAPFLLAASFQALIKFQGRSINNGVLFWQFSPQVKAKLLIDQFKTKTEPHIPAKDLFEAIETWWQEITEMKDRGIKNGSY